jgi:hypothetical protein
LPAASQQPVEQFAAVQVVMHWPPWHCWPPLHDWQAAPFAPQTWLVFPAWQLPVLSVQPVVQPLVPPWQVPAWQVCPPEHATQAAPPVPHAVLLSAFWQTPFESQHPFGQLLALQPEPASAAGFAQVPFCPQTWPLGQEMHAAPEIPQALAVFPGSHTPVAVLQHPPHPGRQPPLLLELHEGASATSIPRAKPRASQWVVFIRSSRFWVKRRVLIHQPSVGSKPAGIRIGR